MSVSISISIFFAYYLLPSSIDCSFVFVVDCLEYCIKISYCYYKLVVVTITISVTINIAIIYIHLPIVTILCLFPPVSLLPSITIILLILFYSYFLWHKLKKIQPARGNACHHNHRWCHVVFVSCPFQFLSLCFCLHVGFVNHCCLSIEVIFLSRHGAVCPFWIATIPKVKMHPPCRWVEESFGIPFTLILISLTHCKSILLLFNLSVAIATVILFGYSYAYYTVIYCVYVR